MSIQSPYKLPAGHKPSPRVFMISAVHNSCLLTSSAFVLNVMVPVSWVYKYFKGEMRRGSDRRTSRLTGIAVLNAIYGGREIYLNELIEHWMSLIFTGKYSKMLIRSSWQFDYYWWVVWRFANTQSTLYGYTMSLADAMNSYISLYKSGIPMACEIQWKCHFATHASSGLMP